MSEEQANPEDGNAPIDIDAANAPLTQAQSVPAALQTGEVKRNDWASKLTFAIAAAAALWGLAGPVGSGIGLWNFGFAINGMFWSFFAAVAAAVMGIFFVVRGRKTDKPWRPLLWLGIALGLGYAGWLMNLAATVEPRIHDISTDLADPPSFQLLKLRADNLDNIPGAEDEAMKGLSPQQRWRAIHQEAYSNVRTVRISEPVPKVMEKAERLAQARGWDVAIYVPAQGRLEATETSTLFRFKDDVVVRVRPAENGTESIIDMRSVSRVGQSDLGVNARRIEAFLADLSGTVTGTR